MSMYDLIKDKLTDSYTKIDNSNIMKILRLMSLTFEEAQTSLQTVQDWRYIDNAKGRVLDDIGIMYNQHRGQTNDEIYRILLKSKRARDMSIGTTNEIIAIIAGSLRADKKDIVIKELWTEGGDPNTIELSGVPMSVINESGLTINQFVQIVRTVVAGGILVDSIAVDGTFEYAAIDQIKGSNSEGFADIDQSVGSYFGGVYQRDDDFDIPV